MLLSLRLRTGVPQHPLPSSALLPAAADYKFGQAMRDQGWDGILNRRGVDLVVTGHFHIYQRCSCERVLVSRGSLGQS